ncbi:MAG TPA: alpha-E domain-containing protein [Pirellulales bacterium]|nr:alpha-E domain-containing protein [Pirellulales bacterium]
MLSRVADSIFWMNRYIERAENVARFIEVNLHLTLGLTNNGFANQWEPLVTTTGDHDQFIERYGVATQKNVIDFLTFDKDNPNSIVSCLRAARENARSVREIISSAMWLELNKFYLMVRGASHNWSMSRAHDFFDQIITSSHLLAGITDATMSHGEAWHFARMGLLLERADKTSRILDVKYFILLPTIRDVGTPLDTIQWAALLKSASALEMYRKSRGRITPSSVVDFLILDRHFPRSIRFCLLGAEDSLHRITGSDHGTFANPAEQRLGRLRAELDYTQVSDIINQGLHEYLDQFQTKLNLVGEGISETFFAPQPVAAPAMMRERQYQ